MKKMSFIGCPILSAAFIFIASVSPERLWACACGFAACSTCTNSALTADA